MNLRYILKNIKIEKVIGNNNIEIDNVSQDTRENFNKNTLYFAVKGTQVDGHNFIEQAIKKGAVAIVCEKLPEHILSSQETKRMSSDVAISNITSKTLIKKSKIASQARNDNTTYILVNSVSESMGFIVSNFYENPSKKLKIIAVTGTNGKTTIATLLYQSLLELNQNVALFSTAGDYINKKEIKTDKKASSSMEIIEFQKNLKKAVDSDCEYVCIEATSHALDQNRLNGTYITGAIYTNLSQDHLNYHKDFSSYLKAKKKLFNNLSENSFALVNIDDKHGVEIISKTKAKTISYGDLEYKNVISKDLTFKIENFSISGTKLLLNKNPINLMLIGKFNMYNILSVYGSLIELGFNKNEILNILPNVKGAKGRMEIVTGKRENIIGIIDYAHSPDALENVLQTLAELPHNKIITVIGVGGDRDREKRPEMAHIAQKGSDYIIFSSDNPRTESSKQIFNDLLAGCNQNIQNFEKIEDRKQAIKKAVEISKSNDIILIAGKGHEDYQIIGTIKHHFDDKEVLEKYL